jgi:hypothetical protein
LIYCAWTSPKEAFNSSVSNDINACSIVLFVITERWPAAKKYRDAFESIKQIVVDPLNSNDTQEARRLIPALPTIDIPADEGRQEYANMVTHMTGQDLASTSSNKSSEQSMAIGVEQVQYQMGSAAQSQGHRSVTRNRAVFHSEADSTAARLARPAFNPNISNQNQNIEQIPNCSSPWPYVDLDGDMDFSLGFDQYDLGLSTNGLGWLAGNSGPTG